MDVSQIAHFFEEWIHAHPQWLFIFILVVSAAESIAIIGMIVPGVVLLFVAGTLAGKGFLGLESALLAAWIGAFAGDFFSFIIGHLFHSHIREWRLFQKHKTWADKGERFFMKYGGLSIFIGRFAGPGRAILPLIGGMMGMSIIRFVMIDIVAGILWAVAYLAPGYLVGASMQWSDLISTQFIYTIIGVAVAAWLSSFLYCHFFSPKKTGYSHAGLYSALLGAIFIIWAILYNSGILDGMNESIELSIIHGETLLTDKINVIITLLGSDTIQVLWAALICLSFWFQGNRKSALTLGTTMITLVLVLSLVKWGMDVPRPPNLSAKTGHSFPSGHTTVTTFLVLCLAQRLSSVLKSGLHFTVWGLALFIAMIVAVSRLYLNVHWFADVTGGLLLGMLAYQVWQYVENRVAPSAPLKKPVTFSVALIVVTLLSSTLQYSKTSEKYLGISQVDKHDRYGLHCVSLR